MKTYEELVKRLREESEIERWLQPHSANETPKLLDDAADAIEELTDRNVRKWIPVTERLPEDMVDVLCYYEYFRYGNYNCMFRTIDRGHVFKGRWFGEAGEGHKNKVFAWMPLPEPPKEGE